MKVADFNARIAPVAVRLGPEGSPVFPPLRIPRPPHETGWDIHPRNNLVGLKVGSGSGKPNVS